MVMVRRRPHPWLGYLPRHQQAKQRLQRRLLLLRATLAQPRHQILVLLLGYLLACLLPLAFGLATLTGFALLPLLVVPPVGFLIYWLVWKEYHH
jgi:hypothetical protein